MAGRIRREDIAAVRERARIEEIVAEQVTLKPAGVGSMKGLCPFHDERTPSFHVRPQLGLWHCFGCDEGGDVISFVQKIDHLSFAEAVERLAAKANVTLRYEDDGGPGRPREETGRRQRLIEAHRVAAEYYIEQLATSGAAPARQFLAERGFDRAAAQSFGVGFAPQGWDHLLRHLRGRGFAEPELQASGLVSQGNRGVYDRFRGRLVWPIRDITGDVIGFGARRLLADDNGPKYLNTPETPIYRKSQVLYGIDLAKRAISKERQVVVVEGYTDVMAAHLAGIGTAIATCGTAFGSDHVRVVRRLLGDTASSAAGVMLATGHAVGGEVIFTFDGDEAGQKAALRAFSEDQQFASQTFVAVSPAGLDPCDLRVQRGDAAVRALIEEREPLFRFAIQSVLRQIDLSTAEGRVAGLRASVPVVARIRDVALRGEYARELAGWLGMDEAAVRSAVGAAARSGGGGFGGSGPREGARRSDDGSRHPGDGGPQGSRPAEADADGRGASSVSAQWSRDPVASLGRQVLEVVLQVPGEAMAAGFDDLAADAFAVPAQRALHEVIRSVGGVRRWVELRDGFARGAVTTSADGDDGVVDSEEEDDGAAASWTRATGAASAAWVAEVREAAIEPLQPLVTELAVTPLPADREDALAGYARGVVLALARMGLTRQIADARARLQRLDPDGEEHRAAWQGLVALEERRRAVAELS